MNTAASCYNIWLKATSTSNWAVCKPLDTLRQLHHGTAAAAWLDKDFIKWELLSTNTYDHRTLKIERPVRLAVCRGTASGFWSICEYRYRTQWTVSCDTAFAQDAVLMTVVPSRGLVIVPWCLKKSLSAMILACINLRPAQHCLSSEGRTLPLTSVVNDFQKLAMKTVEPIVTINPGLSHRWPRLKRQHCFQQSSSTPYVTNSKTRLRKLQTERSWKDQG